MGVIFFFFFFQAEDGIRDKLVTGVQTCALPISRWASDDCSEVPEPTDGGVVGRIHGPDPRFREIRFAVDRTAASASKLAPACGRIGSTQRATGERTGCKSRACGPGAAGNILRDCKISRIVEST